MTGRSNLVDVDAWRWDGTREGGKAIANATGRALLVLHEFGDCRQRPLYLQLPHGSPVSSLVEKGSWVVRTADGVLHEVEPELFDAIRAARLEPAEIEGTPA